MSKAIFGKTQGLKASQHKKLERLLTRNATQKSVCPPEVARALCDCAADTGRMVGMLCDRRGGVVEVALGEATRLYLPDIGRLRAAAGRLRGLRLLVARPERNDGSFSLDHDLITDLERLKLDCVLEIEALDDGRAGRCALASLLPVNKTNDDDDDNDDRPFLRTLRAAAAQKKRPAVERHRVEKFAHPNEIALDFGDWVAELESELLRTTETVKKAAKVPGEREVAVLIGVWDKSTHRRDADASMEELMELARTAGVRVVDTMIQMRDALDGRTLVGKGKLEEICLTALHQGAEMIIFDRDLGPSQLHAITDGTDLKVLDRTMLILDIFARRAKSKGGKLQVELAQLRYSLPRLKERQTGMSRLTGGIGGQGPGETKLEIDKRRAKEKITRLERELERYGSERALRRKVRNEKHIPVVALVGYTNAGKSSLLNALTGADVYAADELFATLDPTSRRLRFPEEREVVLIDTVGFIRDLPETLVHAFSSTLEELHDADLLLHIVDASDPRRTQQIEAVKTVLDDLDLFDRPRILVLNKCDRLGDKGEGERARLDAVRTSAVSKVGLDDLVGRMRTTLWSEGHNWPTRATAP